MFLSLEEVEAWASFLAGGATVATVARTKLESAPATLFIEADLSRSDGTAVVRQEIMEEWGGVDILIDCLDPSWWRDTDFSGLYGEYWQDVLEGNLLAAVRLDSAFVPGMMERRYAYDKSGFWERNRLFNQLWSSSVSPSTGPASLMRSPSSRRSWPLNAAGIYKASTT